MFTPEIVQKFKLPTDDFLCKPIGNELIQFLEFSIKNNDTKETFFEIKQPDIPITWHEVDPNELGQSIHYNFPKNFLAAKTIAAKLCFAVGCKELKGFRMMENHYFQGRLLKSFDFNFGFCIPNTINTWEHIYDVPFLDKKTQEKMIQSPGETVSDSFYFVDNKLVLHNKATYSFS
ncbi:hypothetical protein BDV3_006198 [Batrachochytrium dendrobatidis]|uniref:GMP phosphodiesterase delta subunit domain-containing protein n=1 Tax=Batrachochytrium dendrobatidis (strain JEL423) TaxID=403673 RepID=A0A177WNN6_BATDL|nr:hypothetical protein O5D80_005470 [Batrachochytrium dendrobatidis]KAK5666478.1 hypothetical protein QVD99_006554 [Batrachochytrium dendrobatidis]OAJ41416.1 hypothetical protein BDEG_25020 [Batrachochytrium dendrobatidis JEL423]